MYRNFENFPECGNVRVAFEKKKKMFPSPICELQRGTRFLRPSIFQTETLKIGVLCSKQFNRNTLYNLSTCIIFRHRRT